MSRIEAFKHPIETIRTAPYGSAIIMFVTCMGSAAMYELAHLDNQPCAKAAALGTIALSAIGEAKGAMVISDQLALKEHLEDVIDRRGYNDRVMAATTDEWCNRQMARVVCENHNMLDKYEGTCDERKESAKYSWLPHI